MDPRSLDISDYPRLPQSIKKSGKNHFKTWKTKLILVNRYLKIVICIVELLIEDN